MPVVIHTAEPTGGSTSVVHRCPLCRIGEARYFEDEDLIACIDCVIAFQEADAGLLTWDEPGHWTIAEAP